LARRRQSRRHRIGQAQDFNGARPVGQAADEATFLERLDQTMNAGLRPEIERILHLVEGGRHARLLQTFMDEHQQLVLLACQHSVSLACHKDSCTNHEQTLHVLYVFRKTEYSVKSGRCSVRWRMEWPGGLLLKRRLRFVSRRAVPGFPPPGNSPRISLPR